MKTLFITELRDTPFGRMVLGKAKKKASNRKTRLYIDLWIMANYEKIYQHLSSYSRTLTNGLSSIDQLNNQIDILYHDPDLSFKSQQEANDFLDKELHWQRFIIRLRINY